MRRASLLFVLCVAACSILCAQTTRVAAGAAARSHSVIWILGDDGRLSAYDGRDFHFLRKSFSPLPPDARQNTENIQVRSNGIVLYATLDANSGRLARWYLSEDGRTNELIGTSHDERPAGDKGVLVTSATPVASLGVDGRRLFWFENRLSVVQREGEGDISQTGEFLAWTSDLNGRGLRSVVKIALPSCQCGTGACEETCPIIDAWTPGHGVSDFFFLTRWIPGQTSPDFLETILYRAVNGVWQAHKLPEPVYEFLDAADSGNTYLTAIPMQAVAAGRTKATTSVTWFGTGNGARFSTSLHASTIRITT